MFPSFGIRSAHLRIKHNKLGLFLPLCIFHKLLALREHLFDGIEKQALLGLFFFFWGFDLLFC
jgi:hypothetical protein